MGTATRDWASNESMLAPPHTVAIDEPLPLDCGSSLNRYELNFETYGKLSAERDNAILVCHSLTKDAHAAGRRSAADERPGWWDGAIGPGKMIDTNRYFVISSDTLAAGRSTRPASNNQGRPYGLSFPVLTVRDMVAAQRQLMCVLGIERLRAVIGGCFGGQQALEWAIRYPDNVSAAVVITTTPATSAHTIATFAVMRRLIRADPAWNGGNYYGGEFPETGFGAAIAAGVPLWMSREAMEGRFGRRTVTDIKYTLDAEFTVEAFMDKAGMNARHELDPNGLMYLMRAVEYFDLDHEYGGLDNAFAGVSARLLFVSYRRDWRYPAAETELMHRAAVSAGGESRHTVLDSDLGHGAFLFDVPGLAREVKEFIDQPGE